MTFKSSIIIKSNAREHGEAKGLKRFLYSKFISVASVVAVFYLLILGLLGGLVNNYLTGVNALLPISFL